MSDISAAGTGPLADVRILAVEQYGAGPWASQQLVAMGADVIKIEDPGTMGDVGRYVGPYQDGESSLFFETFNGGKRSIQLDLKNAAGREVFEQLVEHADVVFSNLRGDQPRALGLTFNQLRAYNSRIVCCSLTGYGQTGPRAEAGALDYVIQGLAGWMVTTGEPDAPPTRTGPSLVDFSGGYAAALAILGGLWRARRDGIGGDCDVSLQETALSLLTYVATWSASAAYRYERQTNSAHVSIVPFQAFPTADGWIVVACPKQQLWVRLCEALGRTDLLDKPDFATMTARRIHRAELVPILEAIFVQKTTDDWIRVLDTWKVPCGPVLGVDEALADPQVEAREAIETYSHPTLGTVRRVRSSLRISGWSPPAVRGPFRGEHTADVLASVCGVDDAAYADLAARGAFGVEAKPTLGPR